MYNKEIMKHLNSKISSIRKVLEDQEEVELDLNNIQKYMSHVTNTNYLQGYLKALEDLRKEIDKYRY